MDGLDCRREVPLAARIGIATGRVVVGDLERRVPEKTPSLATHRISPPGYRRWPQPRSVVISQATRRLIGSLFELDDLGPKRLKGFAEPLRSGGSRARVGATDASRRDRPPASRPGRPRGGDRASAAPLAAGQGRRRPGGAALGRAWDWQVAPCAGAARAVWRRAAPAPHLPMLALSPVQPAASVIEQLERAGGFERDDPPELKLAKLEALLARGTDKLDDAVPLFAALLGISTEGATRRSSLRRSARNS